MNILPDTYLTRERKRARIKSVSASKKVERKRNLGPGWDLISSASEIKTERKRQSRSRLVHGGFIRAFLRPPGGCFLTDGLWDRQGGYT